MADNLTQLNEEKEQLITDILSYDRHGRHVYLLGSAEFGPTGEPVLIRSTVGLYNTFGRQGTLINAFKCFKYTNPDIPVYLVKVTGEHATASLNVNVLHGEIVENSFMVSASESNEIYNDVFMIVDEESMTFYYPDEMNMSPIRYNYSDYPNIGLLSDAINTDTRNKRNKIYTYYSCDPDIKCNTAFHVVNPTKIYLYGGECGLNYSKDLLYNCLERTYSMLESEQIDIIVPVDAFLDDVYPYDSEENLYRYNMKYYHSSKDYLTGDTQGNMYSFMDQLITFCAKQLNFGVVTHGVLGFNTLDRYSSYYLGEADDLIETYTACMEYNKALVQHNDCMFMVSVVAGDIMYNHGEIIDNGYLAYAAFCATVRLTVGTANIPLSDRISIYQEFTEDKLKELASNGITSFRHSPLYDKPIAYAGVTASDDVNLRLYVNVRMCQMCISYIDKLMKFYIGMNMHTLINEGIMYNDMTTILNTIRDIGIITSYNLKLVPYYLYGEIKSYITMRTNMMIESVTLCSRIKGEFNEELVE